MRNVLAVIGLLALSGGGVLMLSGVLMGALYSGVLDLGDIPLALASGGIVAMILGIVALSAHDIIWSN